MDDLLVENIDDDLVREIDELARKHGKTANEMAIHLLEIGLSADLMPGRIDASSQQSVVPKT